MSLPDGTIEPDTVTEAFCVVVPPFPTVNGDSATTASPPAVLAVIL